MRDTIYHVIFVVMPVIVFGYGSSRLLADGSAQQFQRFGSLAIFLAIAMLGFAKVIFRDDAFQKREISATEVFLAAVGTLQWGYGDLFHCWYNGNGWTTC